MATNLVVRNIDEELALALKQGAAANGRSAEAEHREILKAALKRPLKRRIPKRDAMGIHGILFYGLDEKKVYYPSHRRTGINV